MPDPDAGFDETAPAGGAGPLFLGSAPATAADRRRAAAVGVLLVAAFVVTAPWAGRPLRSVPASVPAYDAAEIVLDLITALLLYAQYRQLGERSFLALACGYLFTPPLMLAHALSFPDAFGRGSLIGGSQTTAWLWMGWHTGFPLFVAGYALLAARERRGDAKPNPVKGPEAGTAALLATLALAAGVILVTTAGESLLPPLMLGSAYRSPATRFVLLVGWMTHLVALALLFQATRLRRLIDLWIAVTLVALVSDLALSALLVSARYQLGFYLGRAYGFLGAIFVLGVLLRDAAALYGGAVRSAERLRESEERLRRYVTASSDSVYTMNADWSKMRYLLGKTFIAATENPSRAWLRESIPAEEQPRVRAAIEAAIRTRSPFELEHRVIRPDGSVGWTFSRAIPVLNAQGEIGEWFGAASDVTARREAEEALRESEERYRALFTSMDEAFAVVEVMRDEKGEWSDFLFLEVNPAFVKHTGLPYPVGLRATEILDTPNPAWAKVYGQVAETGVPVRFEEREPTLDRIFDLYVFRLGEEDSSRVAVLFTDVTERKRAEEALREALAAVAQANEDLEARVAERTRELVEASDRRQELLRQLVDAQEQERGRIARDLHDDTGQQVTGLLLGLGSMAKSPVLAADPHTRETLERLQALANDVAEKSHRLAVTLRPTALDDLGLATALTNYAREWSRWSGIPADVEAVGLEPRLPVEMETTIYRVAQEALTNVLRHGRDGREPQASRVSILLQRRQGEVLAVVEDDGPGFDVEAVLGLPPGERRLGIFGMQERARLAGGTLTIESEPGQGTAVTLRLPVGTVQGGGAELQISPAHSSLTTHHSPLTSAATEDEANV